VKHIVGFSGGVDSQACARWVLNRYPAEDVILLNSDAGGNEHPLTVGFVHQYSETVHPVNVLTPRVKDITDRPGVLKRMELDQEEVLTFPLLAKIYGRFPSRRAQFCTEILKINPTLRWIRENIGDAEFCRYAGVRRDESESRSKTAFSGYDDLFDCVVYHPLADWTKQMCFDYVKAHGEQINPLYSLGFNRVGCAPCINSGKDDVRLWADRFPEMVAKIRAWEQEVGSTFFPPKVPKLPLRPSPRTGKMEQFNWVDEMVEWSRTDFGGMQFNILKQEGSERPSCESKFGLCE
jgi:3'-phosphoadenosine 5'-phosphosulfate sulfotransferase (PAPS reductase)/FAD synthetase